MRSSGRVGGLIAAAILIGVVGEWRVRAVQSQGAVLPPATIPVEEAAAITEIWRMLAEGRARDVWARANQLLERYPRSAAVLAVAIETDIAARGAVSALATYESWLGSRPDEEPMVVRRIARAILYEWGRHTSQAGVRGEALVALAEDGDAAAAAVIASMHADGSEGGLRMAARIQDPQAVGAIIARLSTPTSRRVADINLLGQSRSRVATPTLIALLTDPEPNIRAEAALALGQIEDLSAVPALQAALKDEKLPPRAAAAGALFRMHDYSGAPILEALATHESSSVRRTAALYMAPRPDETWLALVRTLLNDSDPAVRLDAAKLIETHDPAIARATLEVLARDPNPAISEEAELHRASSITTTLAELRVLMRSARPLARVHAARSILARTR
jgi:HEAT repeat protein